MCQPDASECYTPSKQASDKPGCHVSPDPRPLINQLYGNRMGCRSNYTLSCGLYISH
ncbi:hypothetical protein TRKP064_p0043 (plasmid) [Klebsiella pneumoniae]|uniref:Uncharacterized protein n=1 Tax=Escherichia coli TaxID=562 RepID=A0A7U1HSI7_ECOLX|nr:hypothetical protein [Escherichia coli]BBE64679.1 hypothetical protein TRKP064_p0043 [Klebsiella pneumoniae]